MFGRVSNIEHCYAILIKHVFHWLMFAVKAIIVVSDCYLTPIQQTTFHLYHGENKLILKLNDDEVRFVPDQHA